MSGLLLAGLLCLCAAAAENSADRVVILANSDDPDSLRIARHYAAVRQIPAANLVALKASHAESITWREFLVTIWQPLLEQLVRDKWIDAVPMALTDPVGRQKFAPAGHRIAALVVCRGVPLKIGHEPEFYAEAPPFTARGEFRTNAGAVDAELSLLATPNYAINAFIPNKLFQNDRPTSFDQGQVVKVARLDGPTPDDAIGLIDRALAAERTGLLGRAYVDLSDRDPVGNEWLEAAARELSRLGFDPDVDREPATLPLTARIDAPVLYFGWYAGELNGPFALPGFRFPPGAIALHIHSYSAGTLRSPTSGWAGPLVARGVTATFGNVHEPYLQFTHRPDLLLRALARGDALIDAAYYALPALSWQAVVIGDPLYRPFAVPLAAQTARTGRLPARLAGYAALRRARELDGPAGGEAAVADLRAAQRATPNLAVGMELARRLRAAGDNEAAANALGFIALLKTFPTDEWALAREAAQMLETAGRPSRATEVWRAIFASESFPRELRLIWLPEARQAALAANDSAQAAVWKRELEELVGEKK